MAQPLVFLVAIYWCTEIRGWRDIHPTFPDFCHL